MKDRRRIFDPQRRWKEEKMKEKIWGTIIALSGLTGLGYLLAILIMGWLVPSPLRIKWTWWLAGIGLITFSVTTAAKRYIWLPWKWQQYLKLMEDRKRALRRNARTWRLKWRKY